jgi:hypothetical protein
MARMVTKRLVAYLRRSGYLVMMKPPIGAFRTLARGARETDQAPYRPADEWSNCLPLHGLPLTIFAVARFSFRSLRIAVAVHFPVQRRQIVQRQHKNGPAEGRVLHDEFTPDIGCLLQGRLGICRAVRAPEEKAEVVERLREVGPIGGRVLRPKRGSNEGPRLSKECK